MKRILSLSVIKIVLGVLIIKTVYGLSLDTKDYFYDVALRKIRKFFKEDSQDMQHCIRMKTDGEIIM